MIQWNNKIWSKGMTFLKNTVSLLTVFTIIPAAFAATPRAGIVSGATVMAASGRRMPTVTMNMAAANNVAPAAAASSTTSNLLDNIECIDAYTECITSDDSCGSDFSECTTNVLFHAQMPDCISTLAQCSSAGINSLFGTSSTTSLSNVATTNEDGEVTKYTYPTDGSVLGQKIAAAAIENQYDTQTCVKRYLNCLHKDDVCGEDFELCTSDKEFKKQALFCDSTLARCQAAGVKELFGVSAWKPSSKAGIGAGRVATEIEAGADLAALNAVSTCYKMVDNCFMNACKSNPLRCIEGTSVSSLQAAQGVVGDAGLKIDTVGEADVLSKSQVNRYLRSSCADTIGSNKYCHMTFLERTPSKKDLADPDYIDEVFSAAHNDRKSILESKIQGLMQEFDKDAKDKCNEVIASCAMRTCGGGSGAACYTQVFGNGATDKSINGSATYEDIKTGCAAIVNTDPNCIYAYETIKNGAYSYSYAANDAFSTLVPAYGPGAGDPIGAVASLNSRLSTSYNDAAIANMRKQCQNMATSCVRSMCGMDFVNCYRNRTDIYSTLTNTGDASFDKSMNKVGGVLDYTIVLGLCVDTVKNAPVCEEHLAIERARYKKADNTTASWGSADSTRGGWYDAGAATKVTMDKETVQDVDANGNPLCYAANGDQGPCNTVGANGVAYTEPVMIEYYTYVQSQAAQSLFKDLIYDLEKEAQATYNAKLTKQQNMCLSSNTSGGVMGARDTGSTYMWVKLKNNKVPTDYPTMGLKPSQFVASNELYGSFCRIRVTLQSDDIDIMNAINGTLVVRDEKDHKEIKAADFSSKKDWATAYFAAGDAFTCGSWIPQQALMEIANAVGQNARADKAASQPKIAGWMGALGALGLGTGGAFLGDAIQDGNAFSGLSGKSKKKTPETEAKKCKTYMNAALDVTISTVQGKQNSSQFNSYVQKACDIIKEYDGDSAACTTYKTALTDYKTNIANKEATDEASAVEDAMESIKTECGMIEDSDKKNGEKDEKWWDKSGGATIGAVVGAGAGFGLAYGITKAVQNAELDKAEQEAIQEFMDNVGSKIHCYIGGEEAGTFGDVITTSME